MKTAHLNLVFQLPHFDRFQPFDTVRGGLELNTAGWRTENMHTLHTHTATVGDGAAAPPP